MSDVSTWPGAATKSRSLARHAPSNGAFPDIPRTAAICRRMSTVLERVAGDRHRTMDDLRTWPATKERQTSFAPAPPSSQGSFYGIHGDRTNASAGYRVHRARTLSAAVGFRAANRRR